MRLPSAEWRAGAATAAGAPAAAAGAVPSSPASSSGSVLRFSASSRLMRRFCTSSASDWFMVCMPNFWPACMAE